jgi:hypothetical protein
MKLAVSAMRGFKTLLMFYDSMNFPRMISG